MSATDPRAYYVYRVWAEDGDLLYVGCALDPARRIWNHRYENPAMYALIAGVSMTEYGDRETAMAHERFAIASECPRFNKQHRNLRPEVAAAYLERVKAGEAA